MYQYNIAVMARGQKPSDGTAQTDGTDRRRRQTRDKSYTDAV